MIREMTSTWAVRNNLTLFALLSLGVCTSTPALAASDGELAATSSANSEISVTIPPLIQISGVSDLELGTWTDVNTNLEKGAEVCIYTNLSSAGYQVTASGDGTGGAFEMTDSGSGATIPFSLEWNDEATPTGATALTAGSALSGQNGANTTSQNCGGGTNAYIKASIGAPELIEAESGDYQGTVSILVEPN